MVEDLFLLEPRVQREEGSEDRVPTGFCPREECREAAEDPEGHDPRLCVDGWRRQSHDANRECVDSLGGAFEARLCGDPHQRVLFDICEEGERRIATGIRYDAIG